MSNGEGLGAGELVSNWSNVGSIMLVGLVGMNFAFVGLTYPDDAKYHRRQVSDAVPENVTNDGFMHPKVTDVHVS